MAQQKQTDGVAICAEHLPAIEGHIREIYANVPLIYRFHTLDHTLWVRDAARTIAEADGMDDHDLALVQTAALFHDVGYLRSLTEHESFSAFRSLLYLQKLGISIADIETIEQCIMVTKLGSTPRTRLEQVLCDADMSHLASDEFWKWSTRLRQEWKAMKGLDMTDPEWIQNNINFMNSVTFHTDYGQRVFKPAMDINIRTLEGWLKEA